MSFDVPVVILIFKRKDKIKQIMEVISRKKPTKVYILGDGPRNEAEKESVMQCREAVEEAITWPCEIIRRYSNSNKGVYYNIGEGARWVFEREKTAIFLEDDNLPEESFFQYCQELLKRYEDNNRVLWICGTNYLEKYYPKDGSDYVFTQHLMPCGWASWSDKFLKYYDGNLDLTKNRKIMAELENRYRDPKLYKQQLELTLSERNRIEKKLRPNSWDYQMEFTIRANDLLGISPKHNLIKNIGVDEHSIHGGKDFNNVMTERFCGMDSFPLRFPLNHPKIIKVDSEYEDRVGMIILQPISIRLKKKVANILKIIFKIDDNTTIAAGIKNFFLFWK